MIDLALSHHAFLPPSTLPQHSQMIYYSQLYLSEMFWFCPLKALSLVLTFDIIQMYEYPSMIK